MRLGGILAVVLVSLSGAALAAEIKIPPTAVKPDPRRATYKLPADLKWKLESLGQWQAPLFGDPSKPGPYGVLIKWLPGTMSQPHYHTTDRWAYVVQGTWWVSTSDHYDPKTTWPLPVGSFATDLAGKVHWDGAKDETVILEIVGMGPADTVKVPEKK